MDSSESGDVESGTLTYTSTSAFLNNQMGSASYTSILPLVRQRKTQYFGYVQDEWKATPNLTITAGIRYNFFNALHAIGDDDVPFDFGTCGGYCPRTDSFFHPRYDDFDPRAASHGLMARLFCAWAEASITQMVRKTTRTFRFPTLSIATRSAIQVPQAFVSFDSVPSIRGSGRAGRGFPARSGPEPQRRLRCRLDRFRSAETADEHPRHCQLFGQ